MTHNDAYWKPVFRRGWDESRDFFKAHTKWIILSIVVFGIADIGYDWVYGPEKAIDKFIFFAFSTLALTGLFLVGIIWFTVMAFPKIHRESKQEFTSSTGELLKVNTSLEIEGQKLRQQLERLQTADPAKSMQREVIEEFIIQMNGTKAAFVNSDVKAIEKLHNLDGEIKNYLVANFPQFRSYASKYPVSNTYTMPTHFDPSVLNKYLPICEDRIASLQKLLKHLM